MSKRPRLDSDSGEGSSQSIIPKLEPREQENLEHDDESEEQSSKHLLSNVEFNNDYIRADVDTAAQISTLMGQDVAALSGNLSLRDIVQAKRAKQEIPPNGFIDYTQTRYYDRYKQQEYTRRNDYMKYCHVCRKKTVGKLRVLPGDLKMRKVWILRTNLDEERSAELWFRELACEGSHGGEFCELHFPENSNHLKGSQLFPIDVRPLEGRHSVQEDILFDFDSILLQCVFCGRQNMLRNMLPFIRNRQKRARWIDCLAEGNVDYKRRLQQALRGGVTQFLCDWHVADKNFEINGFGEWRLLKNAAPSPHLSESDKHGNRIYLVDKCKDMMFWERQAWRTFEKYPNGDVNINLHDDHDDVDDIDVGEEDDAIMNAANKELHAILKETVAEPPQIVRAAKKSIFIQSGGLKIQELDMNEHGDVVEKDIVIEKCEPSTSNLTDDLEIEYSDDSDEENDMIDKIGGVPYSERLCQVCSAIEPTSNDYQMKPQLRTWPFDECRHKKWLEIMSWPIDFEESMKTLWQKRRTEGALIDSYHFCPINVCQAHLNYRNLPEKMEQWLKKFCVVCETCMSSESLLVQFPPDLGNRIKWMNSLFPIDASNKLNIKKTTWIRDRLTRAKATRYRLCVYHFPSEAFHDADNDVEFELDAGALPLSMDADDFDETPRGPNSVCKCLLCDDWKRRDEMVLLRHPSTEGERWFLHESLVFAEKSTVKKTLMTMSKNQKGAMICRQHFPEGQDPHNFIAERRVMFAAEAECLLCSFVTECQYMIPFPTSDDHKGRTKWINSMCREPWVFRYLQNRLGKEGRHYMCIVHFGKHAIKYVTGIGYWRRPNSVPLLSCTKQWERQIVWDLSRSDHEYHPLQLESLDTNGVGPLNYDDILEVLELPRMLEIEDKLHAEPPEQLRGMMEYFERRVVEADGFIKSKKGGQKVEKRRREAIEKAEIGEMVDEMGYLDEEGGGHDDELEMVLNDHHMTGEVQQEVVIYDDDEGMEALHH